MNPYYANWSYGYTLHPSTDASRGAYQVQYGGPPVPAPPATNWSQIKDQSPPVATPKAKVFVTACPTSVKTETVSLICPGGGEALVKTEPQPPSAPPTLSAGPSATVREKLKILRSFSSQSLQEDLAPMALLKLHELAIANKLVER